MTRQHQVWRLMQRPQTWICFGVIVPVGMLAICAHMLLELRRDAWQRAEQTSKNLLQVIERDIARNIEIVDLSLQGVVDSLKVSGVAEMQPDLRQLVLFDRAASARDLGALVVTDERGDVVADAGPLPARHANYADRYYFEAHRARSDLGLFISKPLVSRLTGSRMIALSRRISKPDGSFDGIVIGTLNLDYFSRLLARIGLGKEGAINLYHRDGTRIMRHPFVEADLGANLAGTPNFDRFVAEGSGAFMGTAVRDGVTRYYAFTQIGDLPLVLNVALSAHEIEMEWREKAATIGVAVLALCFVAVALAALFGRELKRRGAIERELARLSATDVLTGLPNRRSFDDAAGGVFRKASAEPVGVSLLIVDADHFKRYNDQYGHQVGDEVLQRLAACLKAAVHRPSDLVCRVGGEEFAILLPRTDQAGALRVASRIHAEVAGLALARAGIGAGTVTVSIGLAATSSAHNSPRSAANLYLAADAALYGAKARGRNQTCCAKPDEPGYDGPKLELVGKA